MAQITRAFDSVAQAKAAVEELKKRRFDSVELVESTDRRDGGAVVRVEAPFGTAVAVTDVLERNGGKRAKPMPMPVPPNESAPPPAAKLQPASAQPAKPPTNPAAVSQPAQPTPAVASRSRAELRSGPRTLSQMLGIPELIDSNTFFSGFPLLIRPAPKHRPEAKPD